MTYQHHQVRDGDVVWAFMHKNNLEQAPIKGIMCNKRYGHNEQVHRAEAKYFTPYGKFRTPTWSKTVRAESRVYAKTELEAIEGYQKQLQAHIDTLTQRMHSLDYRRKELTQP